MISLTDTRQLAGARDACQHTLALTFPGLSVAVHADNAALLSRLADYYQGLQSPAAPAPQARISVHLIDRQADVDALDWTPITRKKISPLGLKEAYVDVPGGRWIHKVRTGMVMLQGLDTRMVIGDLAANESQVINFINNQFLNHHQNRGCLLGHAAAFDVAGRTTAIAASSGGGKSTLMLRALEQPGTRFLSNDRILFRREHEQTSVLGVAKHPRVNPGTLLHSPRLSALLPETEQTRLKALRPDELWHLEQKYDVPIPQWYGEQRVALHSRLHHLVLLDWSLASDEPTRLSPLDVEQTPAALDGLRKSPGPFYQTPQGAFPPEQSRPRSEYLDHLRGVRVYQLTGAIDFDQAVALLHEQGML